MLKWKSTVNHKNIIEYKVLQSCNWKPTLPGQYSCHILTSTRASHRLMFVRVFLFINCQFHRHIKILYGCSMKQFWPLHRCHCIALEQLAFFLCCVPPSLPVNVPLVEIVFFLFFASPSPPSVSHTGWMSIGHCVGLLVSLFTFCDVVRLPAVSIGSSSTLCWPSHLFRPPPLQVSGWPTGPSTPQCAHCDRITASHARPAMQSRWQVCRWECGSRHRIPNTRTATAPGLPGHLALGTNRWVTSRQGKKQET